MVCWTVTVSFSNFYTHTHTLPFKQLGQRQPSLHSLVSAHFSLAAAPVQRHCGQLKFQSLFSLQIRLLVQIYTNLLNWSQALVLAIRTGRAVCLICNLNSVHTHMHTTTKKTLRPWHRASLSSGPQFIRGTPLPGLKSQALDHNEMWFGFAVERSSSRSLVVSR